MGFKDAAMHNAFTRRIVRVMVILGALGTLAGLFDLAGSGSRLAIAQQGKDKDKDKGPKPPKPPKPPKGGGGGDPPGPIARWKMDEGTGTSIADCAQFANTGTLNNGVAWTTGQSGGGLSFDGTDDYVRVTRTTTLEPAATTIMGWVKRSGTQATWANVMRKTWQNNTGPTWLSWSLQLNPNGSGSDKVAFETGYSGGIHGLISPAGAIPDGVWTHVAASYDPSGSAPQKKLYVNGALVASETETHAILYDTTSTGDIYLGTNGGGAEYYKGVLDDVRIYDHVLSLAEIQQIATGNQLEAFWPMEEGTGTITTDVSGGGFIGTLTNGVAWTSGKNGSGLSFDGANDYVQATRDGCFESPAITVAAWVKRNGAQDSWANIARKTYQNNSGPTYISWSLQLNPGGSGSDILAFNTGYSGGDHVLQTSAGAIPDGVWTHIAAVYDPSASAPQKKLYVNGVLVTSATETHAILYDATSTGDIYFGENGAHGEHYKGDLDEVRLYSRALAASEIAGLAAGSGLVGQWRLDEGTGTTTADSSGSGNNGTLTNGPTWTTGKFANALSFDGTDDYVTASGVANLPAANASQTISWWMNYASVPSSIQNAIGLTNSGSSSGVQCGFRNGVVTVWNWGGTTIVSATAPSTSTWHHFAYTFDGTTHTLYVDGTSANTSTLAAQTAAPASLDFGRTPGFSEYFAGLLDDIRIYNRTLSASEVAALAAGEGTGLAAVYYDNKDFTGSFVQRIDPTVNFNWGTGSPDGSIGADTFSALWTGQVEPQFTETYTFYTNTDDGVKLYVNGQLIIDFPQDQSATERSGQIALVGGVKYDIRMEYFENTGDAVAQLSWSSFSTPKAIVPQGRLSPVDSVTPTLLNATSSSSDLTKVYLRFNEPMYAATATTTGNYTLSGGLTVTNATISADKQVVTLTASGNVTLGSTMVTANNLKNLEQETMASTLKTIVAGNIQGIPDSGAVTLLLTSDTNKNVILTSHQVSFGTPAGLGELLRITAPGTSPTTVTIVQQKQMGGTSVVNFGDSGPNLQLTVTTPGGASNFVDVLVRGITVGAFENDYTLRAIVSGEERAIINSTVADLEISPMCIYISDQRPVKQTAQFTPPIAGLQLVSTSYAVDFGQTNSAKKTQALANANFPPSGANGRCERGSAACYLYIYIYETNELSGGSNPYPNKPKREMDRKYVLVKKPGKCRKRKKPVPSLPGNSPSNDTDPSDGEKDVEAVDLVINGRGFSWEFVRNYRAGNYGRPLNDFGVQWTYTYADDYLVKDGTGADDTSNILHLRDDNTGGGYVNIGAGVWSSPADDYTQLRINAAGEFEIRNTDGYVSTYHNFSTATTPNKNGRLKEIRDRNGNRITFFYEQIDPDNTVAGDEKFVLAYCVDTLGREVRYQYYARTDQTVGGRPVTIADANAGAFGRLARVKDFKGNMQFDGTDEPDFAGQDANRQLKYDYDAEGNLVRASSPISIGNPTGNNFPNGNTFRYAYYTNTSHPGFSQAQWDALSQAQRNVLLHKLTHIWYPNEVKESFGTNPADSDAAEVTTYQTATNDPFFGFVTSEFIGGTNGNGVPSGGTISYAYTDLNPDRDMPPFPHNLFLVPSLRTTITDRNGNVSDFTYSGERVPMEHREFPRGLRNGEPATNVGYVTESEYNGPQLLRGDHLLTKETLPETNSAEYTYNVGSPDRFEQANLLRVILRPDATRGGDQAKIETVFVYEPIYNRPCLRVNPRGADMSNNGFTPPIAEPSGVTRTMTDPYDPTKTLNMRYIELDNFDYQESTLSSTAWPATASWTPTSVDSQTVLATEVLLVRALGLPEGPDDTTRANSVRTLRSRLAANLTKLALGDLNGDGQTPPTAAGNIVRKTFGSPVLLANANQTKIESAIETAGDLIDETLPYDQGGSNEGSAGGRLQTIVWMFQYNAYGQLLKQISPEGNVGRNEYFAENDPDGDAILTPSPADGRVLGTLDTQTDGTGGGGYLKQATEDTTRAYFQQTTGTDKSGATFNNGNTNPAATSIKVIFTYDDVGNVTSVTNGRGIRTDYFVTELNRVSRITVAADISAASTASPSDPLIGASVGPLTAFSYQTRTFYDYNGNVVLAQVEDRGNTSSVEGSGLGSLPSQATSTTPGLAGNAFDDGSNGAFVDALGLFDRLNDLIETRAEISSTEASICRFRFDPNQKFVLGIRPAGNADSWVYDERDLIFQHTRGASTRPSAGLYAAGDPTTFDRPGGSGTQPSTVTFNYDKNGNLIEVADAEDTDLNTSNNSSIAGVGDVTRITRDGFDRIKTVVDPQGNALVYLYDPDSNIVRAIANGEAGDDPVGGTQNKTLTVSEFIYDEMSRLVVTHRVLFQTPDHVPANVPTLGDTSGMDAIAVYLADASSNGASVPGAVGITSAVKRVSALYEYDRQGRLMFTVQDNLNVNRSDYDGADRVVRIKDSALSNGFSSGSFDPSNQSGNTVETAYDDHDNPIEVLETDVSGIGAGAEAFRTTFIYDSLDRMQVVFNQLGLSTDCRYDSRGHLVAKADSVAPGTRIYARRGLGSTASVTVNDFGNVIRNTYDGLSRLVETEQRLTSDGQGDGTNIGATLEGVKTAASTVDTAQSGDGLISTYFAYNRNSQLLALRDDNGNTSARIYDNQGRLLVDRKGLSHTGTTFSISGGDSGSFNVALRGGVAPVDTETSGTDMTFTYDRDGNLSTMLNEGDLNGVRSTFTFTYDAKNRRIRSRVSNPTSPTLSLFTGTTLQTWKYDGLSRLTQSTDNNKEPDNDPLTSPFDTSDDVTVKYYYDSLSHTVEESRQFGASGVTRAVSADYDNSASGGVDVASACRYPDGRTVNCRYDVLSRLIRKFDDGGSYSDIGKYDYIGTSRVAVLTYQNSTRLTYLNQTTDVGYDGLRREVNHRWESFTSQSLGQGTVIVGFEYRDGNGNGLYDRASNKRVEYKTHEPGRSEQYKYDSAYRLTSPGSGAQGSNARAFEQGTLVEPARLSMSSIQIFQDWDLEGVGNWTRQDDNGRVETRTHSDFNEINARTVAGNTSALTYDKAGNTTDTGYSALGGQNFPGGGLFLVYDAFNRVREVRSNGNVPGTSGTLLAEYFYDAENRRVRKVAGGSTTDYSYDGWQVLEERDGSGTLLQQYVYGNGMDEVWTLDNRRSGITVADLNDRTGSDRSFYHWNTLGHIYALTGEGGGSNPPGAIREGYRYDVYGQATVLTGSGADTTWFTADDPTAASSAIFNPYTFTAQRLESESGLLYFKNRYYSASLGRFLSRDPIGYAGGTAGLYEYAGSGPSGSTDSLGLAAGSTTTGGGNSYPIPPFYDGEVGEECQDDSGAPPARPFRPTMVDPVEQERRLHPDKYDVRGPRGAGRTVVGPNWRGHNEALTKWADDIWPPGAPPPQIIVRPTLVMSPFRPTTWDYFFGRFRQTWTEDDILVEELDNVGVTIAKEAFAWLMTFGLSKLAAPLTWGTRAMEKGTRASRAGTTQAAQRAAAQTGTQAAPGATQAASTAGTTVAAAIDKEAIRAAARETFARANPTVVMNKIVVHHRVELQVLEKYPGRFTVAELNQAHMLRGIPKGTVNSIVHNSIVRNLWNDFYRRFPNATREQILKFADTVDRVALKLPLPVK